MKLLTAFIEASGYSIEVIEHGSEIVSKDVGERMIRANSATASRSLISDCGEYRRGDDDCYFSVGGVTTDYKVTKRKPIKRLDVPLCKKPNPLDVTYDGVSLKQLTENIIEIHCDPTADIHNKWIKYPKASFYAVVDWFGDFAVRANEHRYYIYGVEVNLDD